MIPYEGVLRDVVETVVSIIEEIKNERRIPEKNKVTLFFPEFELAILSSVKNNSIERAELERKLDTLYVEKFKKKEFHYFVELNEKLQTEQGKNYLKIIWTKKP